LHNAGREIENLLILDVSAITSPDHEEIDEATFVKPLPTLRQEFEMVREARWRGEGAFAVAEVVARHLVRPRWAFLLRWLARHRRKVMPARIDFYLSFCINEQYLHLMSDWHRRIRKISRLPTPITVFATGDESAREACEASWKPFSSEVSVVPVGGDHFSMLSPPHLSYLCARFRMACGINTIMGRPLSDDVLVARTPQIISAPGPIRR
jgi:thioesterase domain-containing protein